MQAHEGIEQLKVNLKKEHDLKVDYMTAVWISVRGSPMHVDAMQSIAPVARDAEGGADTPRAVATAGHGSGSQKSGSRLSALC